MTEKTVLIIDDDIAFSEMLTEIFRSEGMRVIVEHDGVTGLDQAAQSHPDLIMLDVMMPRMSGADALTKIRETDWGKTVPILMLTNMGEPEIVAQDKARGAPTECLLKTDWTLDQISTRVKGLLAAGHEN
jgi:DNA-binding response OmpR family regulator